MGTQMEGGGRTIFCFVFTLTASFWEAMHYKLCLYVNRLWSCVCSFGAWFSELELVCLKKVQKRWKLVLRFQLVKRRSLSDDLFSPHFEIKCVFVGCPKKKKMLVPTHHCWLTLCNLNVSSFLQWYRSKQSPCLGFWKSVVNTENVINDNETEQNIWFIWNHYWKKTWYLLTKYSSISL